MSLKQAKWQVFDLVEAFQLSQAMAALHELGVLAALTTPCSPKELAGRFRMDESLVSGALEYLAARTNLLRKSAKGFVVTSDYQAQSRFFIDLYLGAYGENATRLTELLRHPSRAETIVDRLRYARAFAAVDGSALGVLPAFIRQLEFTNMLDLGSGNGDLLLELARQDADFVGWGVEANPAMLKLARSRVHAARLSSRVKFIQADCRDLRGAISASMRSRVSSLAACNVANEMFRDGHLRAVKWLRGLRRLFPDRPLLILDYYGRLGQKKSRKLEKERETLLHDFAQLISGQGIPPASAGEWLSIYEEAGCRLVHISEDKLTTRFIHILRL